MVVVLVMDMVVMAGAEVVAEVVVAAEKDLVNLSGAGRKRITIKLVEVELIGLLMHVHA